MSLVEHNKMDSDSISITDNIFLMENSHSYMTDLLNKLDVANALDDTSQAGSMINSMEGILNQFSDSQAELQNEINDLLISSRNGLLTHEKLADMISTEQIRTHYLVNILGSLKHQIESLYRALTESHDEDLDVDDEKNSDVLVDKMVSRVGLMLRSVESLNSIMVAPTRRLQKTITHMDSEVVLHVNKMSLQYGDTPVETHGTTSGKHGSSGKKKSSSSSGNNGHHKNHNDNRHKNDDSGLEQALGINNSNSNQAPAVVPEASKPVVVADATATTTAPEDGHDAVRTKNEQYEMAGKKQVFEDKLKPLRSPQKRSIPSGDDSAASGSPISSPIPSTATTATRGGAQLTGIASQLEKLNNDFKKQQSNNPDDNAAGGDDNISVGTGGGNSIGGGGATGKNKKKTTKGKTKQTKRPSLENGKVVAGQAAAAAATVNLVSVSNGLPPTSTNANNSSSNSGNNNPASASQQHTTRMGSSSSNSGHHSSTGGIAFNQQQQQQQGDIEAKLRRIAEWETNEALRKIEAEAEIQRRVKQALSASFSNNNNSSSNNNSHQHHNASSNHSSENAKSSSAGSGSGSSDSISHPTTPSNRSSSSSQPAGSASGGIATDNNQLPTTIPAINTTDDDCETTSHPSDNEDGAAAAGQPQRRGSKVAVLTPTSASAVATSRSTTSTTSTATTTATSGEQIKNLNNEPINGTRGEAMTGTEQQQQAQLSNNEASHPQQHSDLYLSSIDGAAAATTTNAVFDDSLNIGSGNSPEGGGNHWGTDNHHSSGRGGGAAAVRMIGKQAGHRGQRYDSAETEKTREDGTDGGRNSSESARRPRSSSGRPHSADVDAITDEDSLHSFDQNPPKEMKKKLKKTGLKSGRNSPNKHHHEQQFPAIAAHTGKQLEIYNHIFSNVKNKNKLDLIRICPPLFETAEKGTSTTLDEQQALLDAAAAAANSSVSNDDDMMKLLLEIQGVSVKATTDEKQQSSSGKDSAHHKQFSPTKLSSIPEWQPRAPPTELETVRDIAQKYLEPKMATFLVARLKAAILQHQQQAAAAAAAGTSQHSSLEMRALVDGSKATSSSSSTLPPMKGHLLPVFHNEADVLVTRTYRPQEEPVTFMELLAASDNPLYTIYNEYSMFLSKIHKARLLGSAVIESRLQKDLSQQQQQQQATPQSTTLHQLLSTIMESLLQLVADCDRMVITVDSCEALIASLLSVLKVNPQAMPMIAASAQMSELFSCFGEVDALKISVDLQMLEYRSMFDRINSQSLHEITNLTKESPDFEYCYKYFLTCQGKSVEIYQRLIACKERCVRYRIVGFNHTSYILAQQYRQYQPQGLTMLLRGSSEQDQLQQLQQQHQIIHPYAQQQQLGMLSSPGSSTSASAANGVLAASMFSPYLSSNEIVINYQQQQQNQEVELRLRGQIEQLKEDLITLKEEMEDQEVEMVEILREKDRAPDALLFFAMMHDAAYVQNLQQLVLQMKSLRTFADCSGHMDFVTLRKRVQVCVVLMPTIEKLVDKYSVMYKKWSQYRLNWFATRKLNGGSADSFSSCPLCFQALGTTVDEMSNAAAANGGSTGGRHHKTAIASAATASTVNNKQTSMQQRKRIVGAAVAAAVSPAMCSGSNINNSNSNSNNNTLPVLLEELSVATWDRLQQKHINSINNSYSNGSNTLLASSSLPNLK